MVLNNKQSWFKLTITLLENSNWKRPSERGAYDMLGSNSTHHLKLNGWGVFPLNQSHGTHCILILPECKQIGYSSKTGQQNIIKK